MYNLTLDQFDFGVRVEYTMSRLDPSIVEHLDEYLNVNVYANMYTWDKQPDGTPYQIRNKTRFKMSPCVAPRLGLTEKGSDFLGL